MGQGLECFVARSAATPLRLGRLGGALSCLRTLASMLAGSMTSRVLSVLLVTASVSAGGCVLDGASGNGGRGEGPIEELGIARSELTVDQEIAKATCSTSSAVVQGLSQQVLDELSTCLKPGVLVKVPSGGKIANASVHPYLIKAAYDALQKAAASRTDTINVSSMYRTVVQQYFLWRRSSCYDAVATPGSSNHETGIAIDVSDPDNSTWRSVLQANGFKWLGSFDRFHFDYVGEGSVNLRGQDVLAFQRLWNRNHPEDKIAEDGDWGPQTEARLKKSPAGGFPIGASCAPPPPATTPWPKLEIDAVAEGADRFSDGPSAAVPDLMEGDAYFVNLVVKNTGDAVAKYLVLGVWIEEPFVVAERYDVETDWEHPGTFEPSDANDRPDNPPHDKPGQQLAVKMNALSPGETKRIRLKMRAARYSIGLADAPDVRVWVQSVPGVYTKTDFGAKPDNVEGRQTDNGGDLKAWAPVDVYSRVRWSFDGGLLEGWDAGGEAEATAEDREKGLVLTAKGVDPQLVGPETSFDAAAYPSISLRAVSAIGGTARLYFATSDAPAFDEARALDFVLPAGATPQDVTLRLADHPAYGGTITRLRIDPGPAGEGAVIFDDIRMGDAPATPPGDAGTGDGAGAPPAADASGEVAGGCGCRTVPSQSRASTTAWALALPIALGLVLRRRRT